MAFKLIAEGRRAHGEGELSFVPCWIFMREPEMIEEELIEISAIADDTLKFERILAWCAAHPDEVPFALHQLMRWRDNHPAQDSQG
jgi:hypothetical protein